jgi:hypothetical protein
MARRRSYSRNKGLEAALRHIEEARQFTREIGGSDVDVKEYLFSLSGIELDSIFSDYGKKFGQQAENYAREAFPKWKSGRTRMSGMVCKRLFDILPPKMPLEKKYELAENIWKHFGPSSKKSYQIGPNTPILIILETIIKELDDVVTEYSIPENVRNRFNWLSNGDINVKEQLLNHFRQLEKTLVSEKVHLELPVLQKQVKEQADITGDIRSVLQIHKHEISIWVVNSLDDQVVVGTPNYSKSDEQILEAILPAILPVFIILLFFFWLLA